MTSSLCRLDSEVVPQPNRIRQGDLWQDTHGRLNLATPCSAPGLMVMVPVDQDLPPLAMDAGRPYPWQRVQWGGLL